MKIRFIATTLSFLGFYLTAVAHEISYIQSALTYTEVIESNLDSWTPLINDIYDGQNNGTYWFKIKLEHDAKEMVLSIPDAHIISTSLHFEKAQVNPISDSRFIAYDLSNTNGETTLFLKVICDKEAVIPIRLQNRESYHSDYATNNLLIGLYYGLVLAVIMFNIFSYFSYQNNTYLYYVMMLVFIALGLACRDGLNIWIWADHPINLYLEPFFNLCVGISCMMLATNYLQLDEYLPQLKHVGLSLVATSTCLFFAYLVTDSFLLFSITEISILILLTLYWVAAIYLFKQSVYARFFAIAYGLILFSSYDFYISPHFGFHVLDMTLNQFRAGAIVEMVVFTYAITYQGKTLAEENEQMRDEVKRHSEMTRMEVSTEQELTKFFMNNYDLTQQEIKILEGISRGLINKEIAAEHAVSINTVKFHIRNIYKKLNINSRKEASLKYFETYQ